MTTTSSTRRPKARPLIWTGPPSAVPGAWFDQSAVDRVVRFLRLCPQVKGRGQGLPLEPTDWMLRYILEPVYGWKYPNGLRIVRTAWVELTKKQGKSTTAAGLGLYHTGADREPGADVVAAAGDRAQAGYVFEPARDMVLTSRRLRAKFKTFRRSITYPKTLSRFQVLSSDARLKHGLNISAAIIDEVHVHKTPDLIEALEAGTGSRDQPLILFLTNADAGALASVYDRKRTYLERVASGLIEDPSFYGVVFAASERDDPFKERTWEKANPGIEHTVTREYLRQRATRARQDVRERASFLRLNLGLRIKEPAAPAIPLREWDRTAGMVDAAKLKRRRCFGGLVMTATYDIAALVLVFPDAVQPPGYDVLAHFWLPKADLAEKAQQDQAPYLEWVKDRWAVATPGNVLDYPRIRSGIERLQGRHDIVSIGYNPRNATQFVQELQDEAGLDMVPRRPSYSQLGPATKETLRLVARKALRHSGHPVLRFMVSVAQAKQNPEGDILLDRQNSLGWIDGVEALVLAVDVATTPAEREEEDLGAIVVDPYSGGR